MKAQPKSIRNLAGHLRRNQSDAERKLWRCLRSRRFREARFRRQHPIGPYIVDFYCADFGLVVELDGGQHVQQLEADKTRTAFLEQRGYQVLRFWNTDALKHTDAVLERIAQAMEGSGTPPHSASPPKR